MREESEDLSNHSEAAIDLQQRLKFPTIVYPIPPFHQSVPSHSRPSILQLPPPPPLRTRGTHQHVVYPWIHQFSNNWTNEDQAASVTIPDIDPSHLPELGLFSMAAGDFLDVYTTPGGQGWLL